MAQLTLVAFLGIHVWLRLSGLYGPSQTRYLIMLSFLMLWISPWILLGQAGRQSIGLGRAKGPRWWLGSFIGGGVAACLVFASAFGLYGLTEGHPYASVRDSFLSGVYPDLSGVSLFALFTIPALIFSPIGEEFFCRGVIARLTSQSLGIGFGVFMSALVFAGIHVFHHGLTWAGGQWIFQPSLALLWFAQMFAVSLMFSAFRHYSGSIWMAVSAHAGFNLVMNAFIFTLFV